MAEDIVRVLDALGEPGTRQRLDFLNHKREELGKQYGIAGRDSTRFGFRRTQFITPDPEVNLVSGGDFFVLTQGGVFPYATIRDRSTVQFSRLVDRAKIELVIPASRREGDFRPIAARIEMPFANIPGEDPTERQATRVDIQQTLADIVDQLKRDRLENIAILVPPGGLPANLGEQISLIRSRFQSGLNVRLDLVLVGAQSGLATELRDAVVDSQGSVLTVTDIDEIGAIAQRLKNDQSSGSWVIVPQLGNFAIDQTKLLQDPDQRPDQHPDDIDWWYNKIEECYKTTEDKKNVETMKVANKHMCIFNAIEAARDLIQEALNKDTPGVVRQKAENTIVVLGSLAKILGGPSDVPDAEVPGSLRVQVTNMIKGLGDDQSPNALSQLTEKNARLMFSIGLAKDYLTKVRKSLDEALKTLRTDAASERLNLLAKAIQDKYEDQRDIDKYRSQLNDEEKAKLESVKEVGPDLKNLAKLLRAYERVLEASHVRSKDENLPIYKRIDRYNVETMRLQFELANVERTTGTVTAAKIIPGKSSVRLARFYAEGNAEFELVLGLSQELPRSKDGTRKHPTLRLVNDFGITTSDSSNLRPDEATSTQSLLVWRVSTPPLSPDWYTPIVTFEDDVKKQLENEQVNFTFSVGSGRPNVQLITSLVQNADSNSSGTIKKTEGPAVIEVQVSAGSSVLGAHIFGFYQHITKGSEPIEIQMVTFRDDGKDSEGDSSDDKDHFDPKHCDRAANDGIYTAFIPLTGLNKPTEFRVFVQADTTDGKATYIGLDDPNRGDEKITPSDRKPSDPTTRRAEKVSTESAEGQAMKFQRATSIHFLAEP